MEEHKKEWITCNKCKRPKNKDRVCACEQEKN